MQIQRISNQETQQPEQQQIEDFGQSSSLKISHYLKGTQNTQINKKNYLKFILILSLGLSILLGLPYFVSWPYAPDQLVQRQNVKENKTIQKKSELNKVQNVDLEQNIVDQLNEQMKLSKIQNIKNEQKHFEDFTLNIKKVDNNNYQQSQEVHHPKQTIIPSLLREAQINKHQKQGLKRYYQSIQKAILLLETFSSDEKTHMLTLIIDTTFQQQIVNAENKISNILNLFYSHKVNIIWIFDIRQSNRQNNYLSLLKDQLQKHKIQFVTHQQQISSSYRFINKYIQTSKWVIFAKANIHFTKVDLNFIQKLQCSGYVFSKQRDILSGFLPQMNHEQIDKSVLLIQTQYLRFILPINFSFQNAYTMYEFIFYPSIALLQMASHQICSLKKEIEFIAQEKLTIQHSLFTFNKIEQREHQYCFIGFPSALNRNSIEQIISYSNNFLNFPISSKVKLIFTLLYNKNEDLSSFYSVIKQIQSPTVEIKVRMRHQYIYPSLQNYQLYHGLCSKSSLVFSSRYNVIPNLANIQKQLSILGSECFDKKCILLSNYFNENTTEIKIPKIAKFPNESRQNSIKYFLTHFLHAQIFSLKILKEFRLELFKWQQLEFYSTEASFSVPLTESQFTSIQYINNSLYAVTSSRTLSQKQLKQIDGLHLRSWYKNRKVNVQFSELNNYAYRRYPKQLIPRIIHQIWLSQFSQISPIRKSTIQSLKRTNPEFKYILWTKEDITREKFPITFDGIKKFQALGKQRKLNYNALIADLMRIQILYKYGGIYLDLKIQGKKSLIPFLKYQQFFLVANQENLVNGLIGSVPGDRRFKRILKEFFDPKNLNHPIKHIYQMTGGTKLIEAYSLQEVYTQICNFQQFILEGPRPCVHQYSTGQPDSDQEVFQGQTAFRQKSKYRVMIPCKRDEQKYLQLYDILGRTYFPKAQQFS